MMLTNAAIADMLEEVANLLAFDDANPFRVRAYRKGAQTVRRYGKPMSDLVAEAFDLTALPTIGKDLAALIEEAVRTGRMQSLEALKASAPVPSLDLLQVEGIGPKRARALWQELGISTPEQLYRAVLDGKVGTVSGFGPTTEARLAQAFAKQTPHKSQRTPASQARPIADALRAYLQNITIIDRTEIAGSYRRGRDTVGDLDIVVETARPAAAIAHFVSWRGVKRVMSRGAVKATVILSSGLQADLRTTPAESWGAMLQYFTGSKAHSIALRVRARNMGLKLNEYGVWDGQQRIAGASEADVYAALGLDFIPPELRENRGEIELAAAGKLPRLVDEKELRGDLHAIARSPSDIAPLISAATERGFMYLAIGPRLGQASRPNAVNAILKGIAVAAAKAKNLRVFTAPEVAIPESGAIEVPDEVLSKSNFIIAAVGNGVDLSKREQTRRLVNAIAHPAVRILSHPTGRQLNARPPFDMDMHEIAEAAARTGTALELSADPARMDLIDEHCRIAHSTGAKVAISAEASEPSHFDRIGPGVAQARRGWLGPEDVLNTLLPAGIEAWLSGQTAASFADKEFKARAFEHPSAPERRDHDRARV